jgi:hypothetical protein
LRFPNHLGFRASTSASSGYVTLMSHDPPHFAEMMASTEVNT